jgi:hypothetical protein
MLKSAVVSGYLEQWSEPNDGSSAQKTCQKTCVQSNSSDMIIQLNIAAVHHLCTSIKVEGVGGRHLAILPFE